jgi:hypothetical protein
VKTRDIKGVFYGYVDYTEDTLEPFYVGKGVPARAKFNKKRGSKHDRIAAKHGLYRDIVFATSVHALALQWEIETIAELKTYESRHSGIGCNFTIGGDGAPGYKHTPEARAKMSMDRKGRKASPETRAKISAVTKGRIPSAETRAKRSASLRKFHGTQDKVRKAPLRPRAKKGTPEALENLRAALRTPEMRAIRRKNALGRKRSPETIEKVAAAHRGRKRGLEARANIRRGRLIYLAMRKGEELNAQCFAEEEAERKREFYEERFAQEALEYGLYLDDEESAA